MSLQLLSEHYRLIFLPLAAVHLLIFLTLYSERGRRISKLRAFIRNLARRIVSQWSDERPDSTIDEELDILLHDVRDALSKTAWEPDKIARVRESVYSADASREYLNDMFFEKRLSLARAITDIYPLLGIVGTVLAIAAGMAPIEPKPAGAPVAIEALASPAPEASAAPRPPAASGDGRDELRNVTQNFGHSVWTTLIGLSLAVFFIILGAWLEPEFKSLVEYRTVVRDIIRQVKSRLEVPAPTPQPDGTGTNKTSGSFTLRAP